MKKLFVNKEACIGCGACVAIDGTHFDFDENGLSEVINNENIETDTTKNAVSSCPTNAISYVEEDVEKVETKEVEEEHDCCGHCESKCCCQNDDEDEELGEELEEINNEN